MPNSYIPTQLKRKMNILPKKVFFKAHKLTLTYLRSSYLYFKYTVDNINSVRDSLHSTASLYSVRKKNLNLSKYLLRC